MAKATQPDIAPTRVDDSDGSLSPQSSSLITQKAVSPGKHITIVALGIFLAALDQTVIVTALWPISTDLQIPVTELDRAAWVVTAYLLGYTVALPLMGRVADVYGQRRIYLVSLGLFLLGSVLCALAPTLEFLIAARALQAIGGGAVLPVGMAMVRHLFKEHRVPFMLGVLGAVAEAGGVIGPLWGALVMQGFEGWFGIIGWRWIFWVNVPLCLLFGFLVWRTPALPRFPGKVDWAGAGLLGLALLALSLGLSTPGTVGAWAGLTPQTTGGASGDLITPQSLALFVLSIVLFAAFVLWQRRASTPLIPLELFSRRNWPFSAANITNFMVGAALIITMVNVPLYVASVLDGTAEQGGFMLLRMTALIPVGAIVGGLMGVRVQFRWVAVLGLIVTALGFWEMSTWNLAAPDAPLNWLGLALNGLGFGLLVSPVTATALQWGGLKRAALSAASVNLARMVGMMVSLSILTVLGLRRFQELMSAHPAPIVPLANETAEQFAQRQVDYTIAYKTASLEVYTTGFLIALLVCLVGIVFALWLRRNPESEVETGPIF
ncbi:MAG: MFS transporter [Chloroflexota bacterium]|nr:MFS transporter [Chloroflexota bacterium]MDQ5866881.1 MFS transporter [Chloroflexota bacterium]